MNDLAKKNPILIMAPHTDDGEIGCGGTIARWREEGNEVYYVAFSSARLSVPKGMPDDILINEVKEATAVLGIPSDHLILFDYDVRHFPAHRQAILEDMIRLKQELKPGLILCPSSQDLHQDHKTVYEESLRAFKKQSILGYEQPWNNITFRTGAFVILEERHIAKKIQALKCYRSQYHRTYLNEESIRAITLLRGTQLEGGHAEAFEVVRWMI